MTIQKELSTEDHHSELYREDADVDLIALAKTIWNGRWVIIITLVIFTVIGVFIAFTSPSEYTTSTIMVPQGQSKSSGLGGLGGLAAIAGINLSDIGSGSQDLSPLLYPEIVKSFPFQKEIIYTPLKWNSVEEPVSLAEYAEKYSKQSAYDIVKKYTIGLPRVIFSIFKKGKENDATILVRKDSLLTLTKDERALCNSLSNNLTVKVDNRNGYLTLTATGPEPLVTAQIADKAQRLLQERITEYRINKAEQNRIFIQNRYIEKKKEFEESQDRLANFRDQNLNMASNLAKTEEDRLLSEYQLAFTVYTELAKQLEGAKIKVKEETPVFSIIQPVSIPVERTKPNKPRILIICFFIGGMIGLGIIFMKKYWTIAKLKWNEN